MREEFANTISPLLVHANWHAKYFSVTLTQWTLNSICVSMYKICAVYEPSRHLLPDVGKKIQWCGHKTSLFPYLQKPTIFAESYHICKMGAHKLKSCGATMHYQSDKAKNVWPTKTLKNCKNRVIFFRSSLKSCIERHFAREAVFTPASSGRESICHRNQDPWPLVWRRSVTHRLRNLP